MPKGKLLLLLCLVLLALLMMACAGEGFMPDKPVPEAMLYLLWGV